MEQPTQPKGLLSQLAISESQDEPSAFHDFKLIDPFACSMKSTIDGSEDAKVNQMMNEFVNLSSSQRHPESGTGSSQNNEANDVDEPPLTPRSRIRALLSGLDDPNEGTDDDDDMEDENPLELINQLREKLKAKHSAQELGGVSLDVPEFSNDIASSVATQHPVHVVTDTLDNSVSTDVPSNQMANESADQDVPFVTQNVVNSSVNSPSSNQAASIEDRKPTRESSEEASKGEEEKEDETRVEDATNVESSVPATQQLPSSPFYASNNDVPSGQGMSDEMPPETPVRKIHNAVASDNSDDEADVGTPIVQRRRKPVFSDSEDEAEVPTNRDNAQPSNTQDTQHQKDNPEIEDDLLPMSLKKKSNSLSKKQLERSQRETQRLKRNMNLAPEMHTTRFVSLADFISNFDKDDEQEDDSLTGGAAPESDASDKHLFDDSNEHATPTTSPAKVMKEPAQPIHVFATPMKNPAFTSPEKFRTPLPGSANKLPIMQRTPMITPKRLSSFVLNNKGNHGNAADSDSDSDLEIVPVTKAATIAPALKKLVSLAKVNVYKTPTSETKSVNKRSGRTFDAPERPSLMAILAEKQREQAKLQKEERIATLKKLGIDVSEDAIVKEREMVEDLLERERQRAEALSKKERPKEKDILDDDADDEDYNPEGPVPDVEFSGDESVIDSAGEEEMVSGETSDDEEEDEEDQDEDVTGANKDSQFLDQTQVVDSAPETALSDMTQKVASKFGPTLEVQSSMVQPGSPRMDNIDSDTSSPEREFVKSHGRKPLKINTDSEDEDEDIVLSGEEHPPTASLGQFFMNTQVSNSNSDMTPHSKAQAQRGGLSTQAFATTPAEVAEDSDDDDIFTGPRPKRTAGLDNQEEDILSSEDDDDDHRDRKAKPSLEEREAARKARRLRKKAAKKAAQGLLEDEAMESEDEWARVAGDSDGAANESDSDVEGYNLENLVDNDSNEKVDQSKIQKLVMEEALAKDDEMIHKLMDDVTNGNWRKRRAAAGFLGDDLLDMDDDSVEYMRQLQARAERKRQKLLEDEQLSEIVNNAKAKAFIESIADDIKSEPSFIIDLTGEDGDTNDADADDDETNSENKESISNSSAAINSLTKSTDASGGSKLVTKFKKSAKQMSIETIRKSLSFLDEDVTADITDEVIAYEKPLGNTSLAKQDELLLDTSINDDDDGFVMLSSKEVIVDRKRSLVESITSKHSSSVDLDMPPPKLRRSIQGSSTFLSTNTKTEGTKEVQILQSLSGASAAGAKYQNAMARQGIKKHPARSLLQRKSAASPSRTLKAKERKRREGSAAAPLFRVGSWQ